MNEVTKEVFSNFVELMRIHPHADPYSLWVVAGGSFSDADVTEYSQKVEENDV